MDLIVIKDVSLSLVHSLLTGATYAQVPCAVEPPSGSPLDPPVYDGPAVVYENLAPSDVEPPSAVPLEAAPSREKTTPKKAKKEKLEVPPPSEATPQSEASPQSEVKDPGAPIVDQEPKPITMDTLKSVCVRITEKLGVQAGRTAVITQIQKYAPQRHMLADVPADRWPDLLIDLEAAYAAANA